MVYFVFWTESQIVTHNQGNSNRKIKKCCLWKLCFLNPSILSHITKWWSLFKIIKIPGFCREFDEESFTKNKFSKTLKLEWNICKILRPPFILPHPLVLVIFGKVQSKKDWYSNETCFSTVSLEKTNYIRKYSFDDDIFFESVNCAYW